MSSAVTRTPLVRHGAGAAGEVSDWVVVEEPLEIRIAGEPLVVTMRTPGHDHELAAGLLLSEGLIASRADLGTMSHCGRVDSEEYGNVLDVVGAPGVVLEVPESSGRRLPMTASCGICGRQSIDALFERVGTLTDSLVVRAARIVELSRGLSAAQPGFERTGGLHAAGIAAPNGAYLCVREDIGRHNAVDKVIGEALRFGLVPLRDAILVLSGRAGFELVQKARRAGIPVVCAISAPSSLAIELARDGRQTLIGFARGGSFNVYCGEDRLAEESP